MLCSDEVLNEADLLEPFFIGIDVFPLLQHAQDTLSLENASICSVALHLR